jgi:hypothetical protein
MIGAELLGAGVDKRNITITTQASPSKPHAGRLGIAKNSSHANLPLFIGAPEASRQASRIFARSSAGARRNGCCFKIFSKSGVLISTVRK